MGVLTVIGQFLKALMFLGSLWREKDRKKSAAKAEIGKEIIDAFKETNRDKRASRLNTAVGHINRMR